LENQIPVFMSPTDRVTQLHPQAPGSIFVTFYDSQGYGGGTLTRLHMGTKVLLLNFIYNVNLCRTPSDRLLELSAKKVIGEP
jgi:hypothetical protein